MVGQAGAIGCRMGVITAGLRVGDVILAGNETPVPGSSAKDFSAMLRSFEPGEHLRLKAERVGKTLIVDSIAGSR